MYPYDGSPVGASAAKPAAASSRARTSWVGKPEQRIYLDERRHDAARDRSLGSRCGRMRFRIGGRNDRRLVEAEPPHRIQPCRPL